MEPDKSGPTRQSLLSQFALLWAGSVIGGSLIAAPAKFQVEELTMPVALLVGRAQFTGLAIVELVLIGLAVGSLVYAKKRIHELRQWPCVLFTMAIVLFAIQQLALMPQLQSRSLRIIAGETVEESGLHLVYVAVECLKLIVLLLVGFLQGSIASIEGPIPNK